MRTAIIYATTEGQTRKIANYVTEHILKRGQEVEIVDAVECSPEFSFEPYGLAILMASLHAGHYQAAMTDFVKRHREELQAIENAFVSVSLAAASSDSDDIEGLKACDSEFFSGDRLDARTSASRRRRISFHPVRLLPPLGHEVDCLAKGREGRDGSRHRIYRLERAFRLRRRSAQGDAASPQRCSVKRFTPCPPWRWR